MKNPLLIGWVDDKDLAIFLYGNDLFFILLNLY